jgi:uncharacterized membrane protein
MTLLILGLLLWSQAHFFKRLAPARHAALGDRSKKIVAVLIVISVVVMIFGYRMADFIPIWTPPAFLTGINNLLMLAAFFLIGMSATKGRLKGWMRHPMLLAVKVWALAHLMVNGDLASMVLFGGMLAWAVVSVILINRAEPEYVRPEPGPASKDILLVVISIVTFVVAAVIHLALGVNPFG